jgi:phage-related protein
LNLFELFVKVGVDDQASDKLSNLSKKLGNGLKTAAKIGTAAISTAAAGITALTTAAVKNYAEYEQLVGGVDTLFKDASQKVQQYANEAYRTAGMSANDYMSTVTSFSASLLQSLGGDTDKAAEYANQALIDMSDNANKMGTDMQLIQNAYQGFAKANYTMLDNLNTMGALVA